MKTNNVTKSFINPEKIYNLLEKNEPSDETLVGILNKARELKGLSLDEVASLLNIKSDESIQKLLDTAAYVKNEIYGKRLVLFAPLYTGNKCSNNCLYCGFRASNKSLNRVVLSQQEIEQEVLALLKEGHKRILMLCGESKENALSYFLEAIRTAYKANYNGNTIRRINVEIAPLEVEEFALLKQEKIGTYACFQETYDPLLYAKYHPVGPKSDYEYRLTVMDRAMKGGIDDVGVGVLFGLADYRFEVLALMEHAAHLEKNYDCGPHTVSVPRIEPADNAPLSTAIPFPVSDNDFKKIIAIIRIALPYTGIILSTRESMELREYLFQYGISQISAGSRTNPGSYSANGTDSGSQFSLGDHRSLDEVISSLIDSGYIPSFCTGCYRKGRVGHDFMDLAKPGLIKEYCMPNALFTFQEYLYDFASVETRSKGLKLVNQLVNGITNDNLRTKVKENLGKIELKERDLYF